MVKKVEENIHLPDLTFTKLCIEKYKINRGIYNTIDSWLFDRGIINILQRRKNIIQFLEHISREKRDNYSAIKNKYCKIGHGNLSRELSNFLNFCRIQL